MNTAPANTKKKAIEINNTGGPDHGYSTEE